MKLWILLLAIFSIAASPNNWTIPNPPTRGDDLRSDYNFKNVLYNHFNQLQVVTTNPSGNRQGNFGDMVIYQATGNVYKFEVEITSPNGNSWQGVNLGVI